MSAERACQCGRLYFASSPYDYSCPDCWLAECEAAVRTIEWVGGAAPPGCLVVERTPITDTWEQVVRFVCGPHSRRTYLAGGTFVPCLITRYNKPLTPAVPLEWLTEDEIITSHASGLYVEDPDDPGRAFPPSGEGWWWLETEVAWVADLSEISCNESECCLARADLHQL